MSKNRSPVFARTLLDENLKDLTRRQAGHDNAGQRRRPYAARGPYHRLTKPDDDEKSFSSMTVETGREPITSRPLWYVREQEAVSPSMSSRTNVPSEVPRRRPDYSNGQDRIFGGSRMAEERILCAPDRSQVEVYDGLDKSVAHREETQAEAEKAHTLEASIIAKSTRRKPKRRNEARSRTRRRSSKVLK